MVNVAFDRYYRYDELTQVLRDFAASYPHLVSLESIGETHEGRAIWLVTLTNQATGAAQDKPAIWVDANIHASEVSGSSAALHLIHVLTSRYDQDGRVTRALDTRAFYIVPRISADGAEWALADQPKIIRSSTRPYPYDEAPLMGLTVEDIDGDGRILTMRIKDDNGAWKAHPDEPRLLVRRQADDYGGTYYRLYSEGYVENYDGITLNPRPHKEGLDLNRNFPNDWQPQNKQAGAGDFPLSEPETYAFAQAINARRNICFATAYHTFSGVFLRPASGQADSEMIPEDLWLYQEQGEKATEYTHYPAVSIFHDFKYHPKQVLHGGADWLYEQLGIFYWAIEIWSIQQQAGIEKYNFIDWYRQHDIEDDFKILAWCDAHLADQGYVDWYPYQHPQLGEVELGGWNYQLAWRNPPPKLLEKEIAPFADWFIWQALATPQLALFKHEIQPMDDGHYHVRFAVNNAGYLPTYCTRLALEKGRVRGVMAHIELPETASLVSGAARIDLGQLEGYAGAGSSATPWAMSVKANTADRAYADWLIHAPDGGDIVLTAQHDRAGKVTITVPLDS